MTVLVPVALEFGSPPFDNPSVSPVGQCMKPLSQSISVNGADYLARLAFSKDLGKSIE